MSDRGPHPALRSIWLGTIPYATAWELQAATSLARLLAERGERAEAHGLLAPVHACFSEGLDTPDLREAKELLETLG